MYKFSGMTNSGEALPDKQANLALQNTEELVLNYLGIQTINQ